MSIASSLVELVRVAPGAYRGRVRGVLSALRGGGAVLVAAAVAVVLSQSAVARSYAIINLSVGQVVTLSGSSIGCGARQANGKPYIYCTSSRASAAYVALMTAMGRVEVLSVKTHKAVFDRTPAVVLHSRIGTAANLGDVVVLAGTPILCDVIKTSGKPTMLCESVDKKGVVRPNSYSFGISDTVVSSLEWDAHKQVHVLHTWRES